MDDVGSVNHLSHQLGYALSLADTKYQMEKVLLKEDHIAYVAISQTKVIGWIHAFISFTIESKPFVEIGGLVVDEKHRGQKTGNKLIDKVREWTIEKNIPSLRVRSNVTRHLTHQFYNKIGFKEIKEQKVFSLNIDEINH